MRWRKGKVALRQGRSSYTARPIFRPYLSSTGAARRGGSSWFGTDEHRASDEFGGAAPSLKEHSKTEQKEGSRSGK
jgi:hypothetical protein